MLNLEDAKERLKLYAKKTNHLYVKRLKEPKPDDSGRLAGKFKEVCQSGLMERS